MQKRQPSVDPDKAGFLMATFLATVVMGLGFWHGVDELQLAFRVVVTFAVAWVATFVLMTIIYRIAWAEFAEKARQELERQRAEMAKQAAAKAQSDSENPAQEEREK